MLTSWFYCSRLLWQPKAAIQSWACAVSGNLRHFEHHLRQTTAPGLNESCLLGAMNMFATSMRPCFYCSLSRCLCVSVSPNASLCLSLFTMYTGKCLAVIYASKNLSVYPYVRTPVYLYACVRLFVSSSVSVCISVCMSVCLCVCVHGRMHTCKNLFCKEMETRGGDD